jgi:hypothetical protein
MGWQVSNGLVEAKGVILEANAETNRAEVYVYFHRRCGQLSPV